MNSIAASDSAPVDSRLTETGRGCSRLSRSSRRSPTGCSFAKSSEFRSRCSCSRSAPRCFSQTGSKRAAASCCSYAGILVVALLPSLEDFNVLSAVIAVLRHRRLHARRDGRAQWRCEGKIVAVGWYLVERAVPVLPRLAGRSRLGACAWRAVEPDGDERMDRPARTRIDLRGAVRRSQSADRELADAMGSRRQVQAARHAAAVVLARHDHRRSGRSYACAGDLRCPQIEPLRRRRHFPNCLLSARSSTMPSSCARSCCSICCLPCSR